MFKHTCNMTNKDSYIRAAIASVLMLYAFFIHSFFLGTVAVVIFYTAYTKFCFIYHLFQINDRISMQNYYTSLLPKYRKNPAFIFDKNNKVVFANESALIKLPQIDTPLNLNIQNTESIIQNNISGISFYKQNGEIYQIEYRGIDSEGLLLVHVNDVTELMQLKQEIEDMQKEIIYAMGEIGETRSKETGNHVKRVALYSKELALLYGLPSKEADILQMASPMHDIGKVGIPDDILNAPRKLTQQEFEIMKTHAQIGYNMLKYSNKPILRTAAIVAREHHEKWDGSGYPRGLSGKNIHIYGRITAVADVFDALGSDRIYKKAWKLEKVISFMKEQSGKHFDPQLVELFLNNLDRFTTIQNKYKDLKIYKSIITKQ